MAIVDLSGGIVSVVAAVSLILAILTFAAARRTGQRRVHVVAAAFAVHAAKSAIAAWALYTARLGHEALEVLEAGFDLAMVLLLFGAFWVRR